jgi:CheY-like chemotaxis protein
MAARILVIDDSENIRSILRLTLRFGGFEVTEAASGEEGLAALAREKFDLVFCDLAMPGVGGLEVIRQARENPELRAVPIIVLSAEEREIKTHALAEGANDVVDKPFAPERIFEILTRYLPQGA